MSQKDQDSDPGLGFLRQQQKKTDSITCPLCELPLHPDEMDHHFILEVDRLDRILKPKKTLDQNAGIDRVSSLPGPSTSHLSDKNSSNCTTASTNGHTEDIGNTISISADECWGTYQKIKNNRQARLKLKSRKRKTEDNVCPICNKPVLEDFQLHVDSCIRKTKLVGSNSNGTVPHRSMDSDDDDISIDIEGESAEINEWTGQNRARTSNLMHQTGSFANTTVRMTNADDTDDELNVDGDETQIFGPPQYSERDVIYPTNLNRSKDSYLRGLVMVNEPVTVKRIDIGNPGEGPSWTASHHNKQLAGSIDIKNGGNTEQIIESLKSKVREYEGYIQNRAKCLICMDDFKKPVVSICCWHVYCEECWLHTLGANRLCPQCSIITSPTDLRRIYL